MDPEIYSFIEKQKISIEIFESWFNSLFTNVLEVHNTIR